MKKHVDTYTFTIDDEKLSRQDIEKQAFEHALERDMYTFDGPYKNIEVKVIGPKLRTETYYDVEVYGEEVCLHLTKDVTQANQGYICKCGIAVQPLSFGEIK